MSLIKAMVFAAYQDVLDREREWQAWHTG